MTYAEKEKTSRQVALSQEERAYLLGLLKPHTDYYAALSGTPNPTLSTKGWLAFCLTLTKKLHG